MLSKHMIYLQKKEGLTKFAKKQASLEQHTSQFP